MRAAALASFPWLRRGRATWAAAALAALFGASPLLLIYQGIVWKDVFFADCAVAGMTALAWAVREPQPAARRGLLLALALVLLAACALVRQNGVVVAVAAGAALGWTRAQGRWRRGLAWGLGWLAAVVLVSHAMNLATQPDGPGSGDGMAEGLRVLESYDIVGAAARDPAAPLPAIAAARPGAAQAIRKLSARYYSPQRVDFIDAQPELHDALASIPAAALRRDWLGLMVRRPGLYLRARLAAFAWVFATPRIDRCLPVALGVQGPPEALYPLGLDARWSKADDRLLRYDKAFQRTPVHSHPAYALLALAVAILLLRRREPADVVVAAAMAAALAFAASFLLISIACDYRYLYFLDLAAMAGALYVALDPPWRPRPAQSELTKAADNPSDGAAEAPHTLRPNAAGAIDTKRRP
jgi:hypothetical protein